MWKRPVEKPAVLLDATTRKRVAEAVRAKMERDNEAEECANKLVERIAEAIRDFEPEERRYAVKVVSRTLERWIAYRAYELSFKEKGGKK